VFNRWLDNVIAAVVILAAAYVFPKAALVLLAAWLLYQGYLWHTDGAWTNLGRVRRKAAALHQRALKLAKAQGAPDADAFVQLVWGRYTRLAGDNVPVLGVATSFLPVIRELYASAGFGVVAPPPDGTVLELARYCDRISAEINRLSTPGLADTAADAIAEALAAFTRELPNAATSTREALEDAAERGGDPGFAVRLIDAIDAGAAVRALSLPFYSARVLSLGLFKTLRSQLEWNAREMSSVPHTDDGTAKLIRPSEHKGSPAEVAAGYLGLTPLVGLFRAAIPLHLTDSARTEHHWIVAGSGHGKTQTLQYMIAKDLERVARGEASVIVIDSQGDLIKAVSGLKLFAPGKPLDGRLCLIDPTDIEYPVALNLFDVGMDRIEGYKPLDRERLMNGILELYDFVLSSLLSAELTQKQSVIFRYITRLMLHIPGATIHTFRELMEPKGYEKYKPHIDKLDGTARAFFETEFMSKQFEETKRQVVRRLWGILENRTFERMFTHPKNKLDLFAEMNAGKVIVINTAKELLKQTGTEIFGRFFIALIAQAAQERAILDKDKRLPTFVYVDECGDYLDQNVALILEQARKYNVGMVLAHQYIGQLPPKLQESFAANTSIKFAGGVSDKDAKALAHMLRATPEFIFEQPKGHFVASVRGVTSSAVSIEVPFGHLESLPRMSREDADVVRARGRARYAVFWEEVGRTPEPDPPGPKIATKPEKVSSEPVAWH
jgi:hypothetical protein